MKLDADSSLILVRVLEEMEARRNQRLCENGFNDETKALAILEELIKEQGIDENAGSSTRTVR